VTSTSQAERTSGWIGENRYEPTTVASDATGPSSQRLPISCRNSENAGVVPSGFVPSSVSIDATWTKLTPSASRKAEYRSPRRTGLFKLAEDVLDECLVLVCSVRFGPVSHDDNAHVATTLLSSFPVTVTYSLPI